MVNKDKNIELNNKRSQIDNIDDQIHDLIKQRSLLIDDIAKSKGNFGVGLLTRPAREAQIYKKLFENNKNCKFTNKALYRMWAEMINAFTLLQQNFFVGVVGDKLNENYEIARQYFGSIVEIKIFENYNDLFECLKKHNDMICLVDCENKNWHDFINGYNIFLKININVFTNKKLYAIANHLPEKSGNDKIVRLINGKIIEQDGFSLDDGNNWVGCFPVIEFKD